MREELGKWFMDIAKYLATAILLSSMFSDLGDAGLFVGSLLTTIACLTAGLVIIRSANKNKNNNSKKRK